MTRRRTHSILASLLIVFALAGAPPLPADAAQPPHDSLAAHEAQPPHPADSLAAHEVQPQYPADSLAARRWRPNARPFLEISYAVHLRWGAGVEIERSPRSSVLFLAEGSYQTREYGPYDDYLFQAHTLLHLIPSQVTCSLGGRVHPWPGAIARPYVEASVGILFPGLGSSQAYVDELISTVRLGISIAQPGYAGVFVDAGFEVPMAHAGRGRPAPIRFGLSRRSRSPRRRRRRGILRASIVLPGRARRSGARAKGIPR
jgi:hypothetical protein